MRLPILGSLNILENDGSCGTVFKYEHKYIQGL